MIDTRKYQGKQFINIQTDTYGVETIDEFDTVKEANEMLIEYRLVYTSTPVYISQRPDDTWYKESDDSEWGY